MRLPVATCNLTALALGLFALSSVLLESLAHAYALKIYQYVLPHYQHSTRRAQRRLLPAVDYAEPANPVSVAKAIAAVADAPNEPGESRLKSPVMRFGKRGFGRMKYSDDDYYEPGLVDGDDRFQSGSRVIDYFG